MLVVLAVVSKMVSSDSSGFLYDVAFSLLSPDVQLARAIEKRLSDLSCFLYETRQTEIVARQGLPTFRAPFLTDSRLVCVLYRDEWGTTTWTGLEGEAVQERWIRDGGGHRVLLVNLDGSEPPPWYPQGKMWADGRGASPEEIAEFVRAALAAAGDPERGSLHRSTRHAVQAQPLPIAFYERQLPQFWESYVPTSPVRCDGCTRGIRFRSISRIVTWDQEAGVSYEERLCPICLRERGMHAMNTEGLPEEVLYGSQNPTIRQYLRPRLERMSRILEADERVQVLGVSRVHWCMTHDSIAPGVKLEDGTSWEAPLILFRRLDGDDALDSDITLRDYFVTALESEAARRVASRSAS